MNPEEPQAVPAPVLADRYFRPALRTMSGYVPGEQPKDRQWVKLNTNENPYPPSPAVAAILRQADAKFLNRYPDPLAGDVRQAAGQCLGLPSEWILVGNGSDDILTIATRSFVDQGGTVAFLNPSYSLYPVLTRLQGATPRPIPLKADFSLPPDLLHQAEGASLFFLARPNAPTGTAFPMAAVRELCHGFDGIVLVDEAYADFADDHAVPLIRECPNVIVSRTLSKAYSLAAVRLGFACASPAVIEGMMKVKDSYNVNLLTQRLAAAALRDQAYLQHTRGRICRTREQTAAALAELGFTVCPSAANFLFVKPPLAAAVYQQRLRDRGVLVRYFAAPETAAYVRITIGTDAEMAALLAATQAILEE